MPRAQRGDCRDVVVDFAQDLVGVLADCGAARILAQNGPAISAPSSSTRMPVSGRMPPRVTSP